MDEGVAVEQHQVPTSRALGSLVRSGTEPAVLLVRDEADVLQLVQLGSSGLVGGVVDDDQFERTLGVLDQGGYRALDQRPSAARDHHHRQLRLLGNRDREGHPLRSRSL